MARIKMPWVSNPIMVKKRFSVYNLGWALSNFWRNSQGGRLLVSIANSRMGAYSSVDAYYIVEIKVFLLKVCYESFFL